MVTQSKTITWPEDSTYVNVNREEELVFWSKRFRVSSGMLRQAVRSVGPKFKDVSVFLANRRQV
jgi:hypothetical protein